MHRIDTLGHVANRFDEGDPLIPRPPTKIDQHWMNAVQEELVGVVEAAGLTPTKGTWTQLLAAIDRLSPVRAACTVETDGSGGVTLIGADRNVASVAIIAAGGSSPARVRVTFDAGKITTPITATVTPVRHPSVGTLPTPTNEPRAYLNALSATELDFYLQTDAGANVSNYAWRFAVAVFGT